MALIKKYNTGGSFKEYLKEDLLKNAGSVEVPKEIFERQGTIDPNDESTLEGLSSKGRDYIQNLNSKYKKKSENASFTNYQLDDKPTRDSDFLKVLKDEFGSLEGIYNHYEKSFLDSGGNDAIKQDLTTRLKSLVDNYFQEHTANPHDNWIRLKEFQNLQQALNIGNWDDISDKSRKLGWNLDSLMFSDDRLKQRQAEKDQERQQAEINAKLQDLQNIGFSPEMAGELLRQGYRPYDNQHFSDYGFMDNLKSLGYNLISNVDNSAHFLTKDGQLVNNYGDWISKDILNKYYGYSIGTNDQGAFRIYKPEEHELNTNVELWEDYADRKIKLTPGEGNDVRFSYHDWYGTSGDDLQQNFHKNALGLRNLLGQITRVDRRTGQENVYTLNDKGEYLDLKGNKAEVPTWGSYTDEGLVRHSLDKYFKKNKNSPLYGITGKAMTKPVAKGVVPQNTEQAQQMIDEVEAEVERIQKAGDTKTKNKYRKNLSDAARHIFYLAEKAEKEGNFDNFDTYHELLMKVADIMEAVKPEEEGGEGIPIMRGTTFNKEGGVLKAQSGSVLEELYKRSTQKSNQAPSVSDFNQDKINPGRVKFLNKTMSEMDALDALSLAGNVASVIPVIGGFGAAATTAIDIARGLKKDKWEKEDTLNLFSNLGFTALSFAGLGGARALKVGAQAAKGSGRFAKLAKSAKEAVKIKPTPFGKQVAKGAKKMGKVAENSDDVRRLVDLAEGTKTIGDVAKAGASADDLRLLQQIAGRRHNWVQSAAISGAKGVGKGFDKAGELITNPGVGEWVGRGVKAGIGYQGVMGGLNVAQNIAEADGNIFQKIGTGFLNTEQSDVKNILFASGLGINQAKSVFRTHAAKRNIRPIDGSGTKATTTLKIGDQTFELNKTAEKGKALKSLKPKALKDALTRKESKKLLESLSTEDLKDASQATEFKKILDGLKPAKEGAKVKVPKVTLTQNKPEGFKYGLSEHALDSSGQKSYGWWDNVLHKSASKSWDKGLSGHYGKTYKWDKSDFKEVNKPSTNAKSDVSSKSRTINDKAKKILSERNKIKKPRNKSLKKGGILKAANGLTLPSYIAPMSERRLRGIGEPFKWEKNFTINPQTSTNKYNLGLNTNTNTPLYNTFRSTYDRNMGQPVVNPKENRTASYEDFKAQDFDPYKDRSQLAKLFGETIKFANTWNTNQNVYQNRIRALNEKAFKMNTMPYTHLRSPGQFNYVNAINTGNQMLDNVKGITSSSADIDKNAAYKIQTAGQLMKYYNQALAQDNQALYNHDNMVQQMRDEVQRQNLGIDTQQKQLWADVRSGMHLEGSNKDLQQGNNINTWIGELMKINSERPAVRSRENYINAVLDPNTLNFSNWLYDLETTKLAEEQKLHKEEEEQRKAFGPTTYQEMKWEDSNRYKIWQEQVIAARRQLQSMEANAARKQQLASMFAPTTTEKKQKGGRIPLHEKIALENVRHRNRLTRQTEKEYYKRLLENNKLVQEAMVKVFK